MMSWPCFRRRAATRAAATETAAARVAFKLSLRGQDPDLDWLALTRDQGGRRVNLIEPEKSLILLKATGAIAHEGGKRFAPDSPEYAALLAWLREGAPDSGGDRAKLTKLEVTPTERVLIEPERRCSCARSHDFADGTQRDVTRLAVLRAEQHADNARSHGRLVTRDRSGESTVLVRYLDQQVPVHLAFVPARPDFVWSEPPADELHRRARLREAADAADESVGAVQRRSLPAARVSRSPRRRADGGEGAALPRRHAPDKRAQSDRAAAGARRSSPISGR